MKTLTLISSVLILGIGTAQAQTGLGDRIKDRTQQTLENRVEQKVDKTVNKGVDKVENKIDSSATGKKKNKEDKKSSGNSSSSSGSNEGGGSEENSGASSSGKSGSGKSGSLTSYSKYDFVPGAKIIAQEDFMQDAVGDFPAKWNTNSSGEIVTVEGDQGHWLKVQKEGCFLPEFITDLPENFTLEYDLYCSDDFNYYSTEFFMTFAHTGNAAKEFADWGRFPRGNDGVRIGLHPTNAGDNMGNSTVYSRSNSEQMLNNSVDIAQFNTKNSRNKVHISVWRQKTRLRVYANEEKIWDLPRAFIEGVKYNSLVFGLGGMNKEQDYYLFSNLRFAVGAPDTRNKLITEGKLVTRGILFASGSDVIRPESYGTIKDIANVLKENPDVKVKIIGHTDSDGDDKTNLELSKKRALAVKNALVKDFGIDATRIETDGKGESEPSDANTTPAGKANNRRVEFIKL
ncbi:MAG: OmpA family protein [Bacteroidia bacterium]